MALLLTVFLLTPVFSSAQIGVTERNAIQSYREALESAQRGRATGAVERAFLALEMLSDVLTRSLESLSAEEFDGLRRQLPGIRIGRDEVVFAQADPDFFAGLAREHGDAADRAFFTAFKATHSHGLMPVYIEQQTDYSACTRFGTGKLIEIYGVWSDYRAVFRTGIRKPPPAKWTKLPPS